MKIIECPRDAMQGIEEFIPTAKKVDYLNSLLKVGFDTVDFGSFVSPKAVPQMMDTAEVLRGLDLGTSRSSLLAIIANSRGVDDALQFEEITYLGYPLSISETFQQRNTNSSIDRAFRVVEETSNKVIAKGKQLVVYISMGFGNPYGDPYNSDVVFSFFERLQAVGIGIISLSDTVGIATSKQISDVFRGVLQNFPEVEVGAHLHSRPEETRAKVQALIDAGCQRVDGALKGYGGCPMAKDDLVGNLATELILEVQAENGVAPELDKAALAESLHKVNAIFPG